MATDSDARALSVVNSVVRSLSGSFHRSLNRQILRKVEKNLARNIPNPIEIITDALTRAIYETICVDKYCPSYSYHHIMDGVSGEGFGEELSSLLIDKDRVGEDDVEGMLDHFTDVIADSVENSVLASLSPKSLTEIMNEALLDAHDPIVDALGADQKQSEWEIRALQKTLLSNGWKRASEPSEG